MLVLLSSLTYSMLVKAQSTDEGIRKDAREIIEKCPNVENIEAKLDQIMDVVKKDKYHPATFKKHMEANCYFEKALIISSIVRLSEKASKNIEDLQVKDPQKEKIAREGFKAGLEACKTFRAMSDKLVDNFQKDTKSWKKIVEGPYDWNVFKNEMGKHCDITTALTKANIVPVSTPAVKYTIMCKSDKKEFLIPALIDEKGNVKAEGAINNLFVTLEFNKLDVSQGRTIKVGVPEGVIISSYLKPGHGDITESSGFVSKKLMNYTTDFKVTCYPLSLETETKLSSVNDSSKNIIKENKVDNNDDRSQGNAIEK
ncbi:MAG: hypothetical protein Q7U04_14990 [Bacteriovorax sp.]|nr:hypothetical protein [Bacteriovorax sp.]